MKNIFLIIIFFSGNFLFSQVKLDFKLDFNSKIAQITIVNNTPESYAIPLEKKYLRPYEPFCNNYEEYEDSFPGLGLMLMIEQQSNNELLTYYVEDYVDPSKFDSITKEYQKKKIVDDHIIDKWKMTNKIAKVKNAKINYNIMNSFIFLKPYESIHYKVMVNINNITDQKFKFYSYSYDPLQSYRYYLAYCSPAKAYEYLTKKQKKKIREKGYKLFYDPLKSNILYSKIN